MWIGGDVDVDAIGDNDETVLDMSYNTDGV